MSEQQIRIPNLPLGQIADENGNATQQMLTFLQTLVSNLQLYFGNEGMVAPSQDTINLGIIAANTKPNPSGGVAIQTLAPGTFLYNTSNDTVVVSVLSGGIASFKTITVT